MNLFFFYFFLQCVCAVFCFIIKKVNLKQLMINTHIILFYLSGTRHIKCSFLFYLKILGSLRDIAAIFNILTKEGRY